MSEVVVPSSARRRIGALALPLLVLAAVAMVIGEASRAESLVCDKTFVGAPGGDWMDGGNWSPAGVPGPAENACASDLVVLSASTTVGAVDLDGGLSLSFGQLTIASGSEVSTIAGLAASGQVSAINRLELSGTNSFGFGESFQGPGTLNVQPGATLTVQAGSRIGDSDEVDPSTIENDGTITLAASGNLFFHNDTHLVNDGTFSLPSGGTLRWFSPVEPNPDPKITNSSTGTLDLGAATSIEMPFENDGNVNVATSVGLTWPDGLNSDDGTYTTVNASAVVRANGDRTFTNATPILGDGLLTTGGFEGMLTFNSATVGRLDLESGGTAGNLTVTGHLLLGSPGPDFDPITLLGPGTTTITPGATVAFGANDFTSVAGGHVLLTQAPVTIPAGGIGVCGTSELRNESTLTLDGPLQCSSSPHGPLHNDATGTVLVTGADVAVRGELYNTGVITVDGGSLAAGGGTHTGSLVLTQATDTAELGVGATEASFTGTASVAGLGELQARAVNWSSSETIPRLKVMPNGYFSGTATITNSLDIDGALVGPGTVTVAAMATAMLDPAQGLNSSVQLVNNGAMVQSETFEMCDGASITNNGTWSVQNTVLVGGGCASVSVTNDASGVVTLADTWTVSAPFNNHGTLDLAGDSASFVNGINSGTLVGPGSLSLSGVFDLGLISTTDLDVAVAGGTVDATVGSEVDVMRLSGGSFVGDVRVTALLETSLGSLGGDGATTLDAAATVTFTGFPEVLTVDGTHELRVENSLQLDGAGFLPQVVILCDDARVTVVGSLGIVNGGIKDCGGSTAQVQVESTGELGLAFQGGVGLTTPIDVPIVNDGDMFTASFTGATLDAFTNNGTYTDVGGSTLTMSTIVNTGYFQALSPSSFTATTVTNTGELLVGNASFDGLSNFSGSTISGGTLEVHGTLAVDGLANLLTNSADLTVGEFGQITDELANDRFKVRTNTATGRFSIVQRNHTVAIFSNSGVVGLHGANLNASSGYFQSMGTTSLVGGSISKSQFFGGRVEGFGSLGGVVRVTGATLSPGLFPGDVGFFAADTLSLTAASTFEADLQVGCGCGADLLGGTSSVTLDGTLALSGEGDPGSEATVVAGPRTGLFHTTTGTFVAPSTNLLVDYAAFGVYVLTSPPPEITFSPSDGGQLIEGTDVSPTQYGVDVYLAWPAIGTISIDVVPTDGTAASPTDFDPTPQTLTFLPGETQQTAIIDVVADNNFENDETFDVSLTNLVGDAIADPVPTTITILDDDPLVATNLTDSPDAAPGDGACDDGTGACTLRAAIMEANVLPGPQNLALLGSGYYELTIPGRDEDGAATGDLDITDALVITVNYGDTIDAGGLDRVFDVHTTGVVITGGGTLTGGSALAVGGDPGHGGSVFVRAGAHIDVDRLNLQSNAAARSGGGVAVLGSAGVAQATISDSTADVDGGGLFVGSGATLVLADSQVHDNEATHLGGGVAAEGGAVVTVTNTNVNDNDALEGGGGVSLRTGAAIDMSSSTVDGNYGHVFGGGFHVRDSSATIHRSHIRNNTTLLYAGGILQLIGTMSITETTIDGNTAAAGGGILTGYATLDLRRSTISNNTGIVKAGGIGSGSDVTVENSTISGNTSPEGAGFFNQEDLPAFFRGRATLHSVTFGANNGPAFTGIGGSILLVTNSVFAPQSGGAPNCVLGSPATSGGYNLTSDTSCGFAEPEDLVGDAELGALTFNGGTTNTQLPYFWAIDTGGACLAEDQRGYSRPQGLDCDRGAVDQ